MDQQRIDAYLVCGGRWHDFDFARLQLLELLGADDRIRTRVAENYRDLHAIAASEFLVTYTCDVRPSVEEQDALAAYVANGGRWLALHGTNAVLARVNEGMSTPRVLGEVARVLGSQFIAHPPISPYRVEVVAPEHPLVYGIDPFDSEDELYLCERHEPEAQTVLLQTHWTGTTRGFLENDWTAAEPRPVMYLRPYGAGEVLYLTLGHCRGHYDMAPEADWWPTIDRGSWELPQFRELLRRSIRWAVGTEPVAEVTDESA